MSTAPHDNEAHYLCRLKHYWNPPWCAGDLFLESADAQLVFIWTFGWVTRFLSLPATAWVGRFVAWSLLAWAWQRLSWRLVPRPLASVLSAALFVTLNANWQLAGEWVVGGVEAKCFAYVFVVLALRELVDDRWNRLWLFLGAAAAFHPVVGGWCLVICGGQWLLASGRELQNAKCKLPIGNWQSIAGVLPGLIGGGFIALLGVIPALQLTWGQPAEVVTEASRIYVFDRLPHHLALLTLPHSETVVRLSQHALLLLALWLLSRPLVANSRFAISSLRPADVPDGQPPVDAKALRQIIIFAWSAALIAVCGFVIELALSNAPDTAACLLRFYWFRMTDFGAPMAVSLVVTALIAAGVDWRRAWAAWGLAVAVAFCGWNLLDRSWQRFADPVPPADRKLQDYAAWLDVCDWVVGHTEPDALFLTPRLNQSFKWRTGRAEVVTRKDMPQDAASIVEWHRRYHHIYYEGTGANESAPPPSLGTIGTQRVRQLAHEYGAKYIISGWNKPLWLPVLYPNVQYANEEYIVYRVDDAGPTTEHGSDAK